jgi:Tol biopolymer transport system component
MDSLTGMPNGTARRISMLAGEAPAWSPDGRRIAFVSNQGGNYRVAAVPFNGGDAEILFEGSGTGRGLSWSSDGRLMFATVQVPVEGLHWVRLEVATKRADRFVNPAGVQLVGFSPDGSQIAQFAPTPSVLSIVSASTGEVLERRQVPRFVTPIGWSRTAPGEVTALEVVVPSHLQRVTLPSGTMQSLHPVGNEFIADPSYSPDGRSLAFERTEGSGARVHVSASDGSNVRPLGEPGDIGNISWSPSGSHIAYSTSGPTVVVRVIDVATGTDRVLVQPRNDGERAEAFLGWRADGQAVRYVWRPSGEAREVREVMLNGQSRVVTAISSMQGEPHFVSDTLLLLQKADGIDAVSLSTGTLRTLYAGPIRSRGGFGLSPDGGWVAVTGWDGDESFPVLVSLDTGESRRIPYALGGETAQILFHPDGRNLVVYTCLTCMAPLYLEKWDIVLQPMNGDPARVLTRSQTSYKDHSRPTMSPDGNTLVFVGEQSYNTRIVSLRLP